MSTKVYGSSDDLVILDGDIRDEVGCYGTAEEDHGVLLVFSDGTALEVKYGKMDQGIWEVKLLKKGELFIGIEPCLNESDDPYSDVATFKDGLKWGYAATEWNPVYAKI